jgi:hypothetical protein
MNLTHSLFLPPLHIQSPFLEHVYRLLRYMFKHFDIPIPVRHLMSGTVYFPQYTTHYASVDSKMWPSR